MTNGQAVMHYSRYRLTASVSNNVNGLALFAHGSVRQKLNCVSSVTSLCTNTHHSNEWTEYRRC